MDFGVWGPETLLLEQNGVRVLRWIRLPEDFAAYWSFKCAMRFCHKARFVTNPSEQNLSFWALVSLGWSPWNQDMGLVSGGSESFQLAWLFWPGCPWNVKLQPAIAYLGYNNYTNVDVKQPLGALLLLQDYTTQLCYQQFMPSCE